MIGRKMLAALCFNLADIAAHDPALADAAWQIGAMLDA